MVDHLRRCVFLYLLLATLGVPMVLFMDLNDPGAGGSLAVTLCVAAGYATIIDATLLSVVRRRARRTAPGRYA